MFAIWLPICIKFLDRPTWIVTVSNRLDYSVSHPIGTLSATMTPVNILSYDAESFNNFSHILKFCEVPASSDENAHSPPHVPHHTTPPAAIANTTLTHSFSQLVAYEEVRN